MGCKIHDDFYIEPRALKSERGGGGVKDDGEKIRSTDSASPRERCRGVTLHLAPAGVHLHNEIISFRPANGVVTLYVNSRHVKSVRSECLNTTTLDRDRAHPFDGISRWRAYGAGGGGFTGDVVTEKLDDCHNRVHFSPKAPMTDRRIEYRRSHVTPRPN